MKTITPIKKKKKSNDFGYILRNSSLQNNSQCLLLNIPINATRFSFQFVRRNKITKNEHAGIKRKTI